MRAPALLLFLVLFSLNPALAQNSSRVDALFKSLSSAPNSRATLALYHQLEYEWSKSESSTAELLYQRAASAFARQNYDVALNILNIVLRLNPDWIAALDLRAQIWLKLDSLPDAQADIDQVLKLEPRAVGALFGASNIALEHGDMASALDYARKVQSLAPNWPEIKQRVERLSHKIEGQEL